MPTEMQRIDSPRGNSQLHPGIRCLRQPESPQCEEPPQPLLLNADSRNLTSGHAASQLDDLDTVE